jgi:hypothetical protein
MLLFTKNKLALKKRCTFSFFLKKRKKRFLSTSNSATEWSEPKNYLTKIFTVKNCPRSEVLKLIGPFYRLLIFCSGGLAIEHVEYKKYSGVLGVTKIFQMIQPITSSQFNIIYFDWSNFCRSDQNCGHSEHTQIFV